MKIKYTNNITVERIKADLCNPDIKYFCVEKPNGELEYWEVKEEK